MTFRPKYITFDCYGTLTYYPMHQAAYDIYEGQLPAGADDVFIKNFNDYRFDEAMGDWKPYLDSCIRRWNAPAGSTSWPSATSMRSGSTTRCPPGARTPTCRTRSRASRRRSRW